MTKLALIFLLILTTNANGHNVNFDKVCDIVESTNATIDVKVVAATDICSNMKWDCYGSIYTVVPSSSQDSNPLKIISSSPLGTGLRYTLLVSNIVKTRQVFLYNLEYRTFQAPLEVDYFLDMNAAFETNGHDFFREMPLLCSGNGPDCLSFSSIQDAAKNDLLSVKAIYPNFSRELASCPR